MSLKSSISLSLISQIVNLIVGFALSVLISRALGADGRGEYVLVTTGASFLVQFFMFGIDSSISHYVAANKMDLKKLISTATVVVAGVSILLVLTVGITSLSGASFLVPEPTLSYFAILTVFSLLMLANNIYVAVLNGIRKFRAVLLVASATQIMSLLFIAFAFFFSGSLLEAKLVLILITCVYAIVFALYTYFYSRYVGISPSLQFISKAEIGLFFSYSFISFVCSVLQFLSYRMDYWVINYYWGEQNLGVYSLSSSLAQLLWILPQSIAAILFPMSSYFDRKELLDITGRISRISVLIALVAIVFLLAASPFMIPVIFGNAFGDSVKYFQLFLIGVLPFVITKVLASVFAGIGKVKYNLFATLTGFVFAALGYFLLIPHWGLVGGAIGSVISYISTTLLVLYLYKREFNVPIVSLLIVKQEDVTYLSNQVRNIARKVYG